MTGSIDTIRIRIFVVGPFDYYNECSVTKQFIQSISHTESIAIQIEDWNNKSITFDYGSVQSTNKVILQLYGTQQTFHTDPIKFMIERWQSKIDGIIFLVDNPDTDIFSLFKQAFQSLRKEMSCPYLIAANSKYYDDEMFIKLHEELNLSEDEVIILSDLSQKADITKVFIKLLSCLKNMEVGSLLCDIMNDGR